MESCSIPLNTNLPSSDVICTLSKQIRWQLFRTDHNRIPDRQQPDSGRLTVRPYNGQGHVVRVGGGVGIPAPERNGGSSTSSPAESFKTEEETFQNVPAQLQRVVDRLRPDVLDRRKCSWTRRSSGWGWRRGITWQSRCCFEIKW